MPEPTTISFVADTDLKAILEQWAKDDDRSVSSVIRFCIDQERKRRETALHLFPAHGRPAPVPTPDLPGAA